MVRVLLVAWAIVCLIEVYFFYNWQTRRKTKQGPDVPANHIHSIIVGDLRNQTCICGNVIYHVFFYTLNACDISLRKKQQQQMGCVRHCWVNIKPKKNRIQVTIKFTKKTHTWNVLKKRENYLKSRNNDTTENTLFAPFFLV